MLAATFEDDPNHIVAATALDLDGNVHVGVGSHRVINDGPCAELVVLGIAGQYTCGLAGDGGCSRRWIPWRGPFLRAV